MRNHFPIMWIIMSIESTEVGCFLIINSWYHTVFTSLYVCLSMMLQFKTPTDNFGFTFAWLGLASCWATLRSRCVALWSDSDWAEHTVIVEWTGVIAGPGSSGAPATPGPPAWPSPSHSRPPLRCRPAHRLIFWLYLTMSSWCISRLFCCRGRWSNSL